MLTLRRCDLMIINDISFHAPKRLYLHDCCFYSELDPSTSYISAPCVEYLKFWGYIECGLKLKDVTKLKKANFFLSEQNYYDLYNCGILCSLSGVESLNLDSHYSLKKILVGEVPNCLAFHKLRKLILGGGCMHCDFGLVSSFLKHCSNLEILTLYDDGHLCQNLNEVHTKKEHGENLEGIQKFGCDQSRLIEIVHESGDLDVDRVVRRLVRSTIGINDVQIILKKNIGYQYFWLDDMYEHDFSYIS